MKLASEPAPIRQRMGTPRAAAIAGIIFSCLFVTSLVLMWISIPANPLGPATDVINHSKIISFALNLLPFAGIAFLWFVAVLRDRVGELEDRFFATVFLGSGLLFIAMIFTLAAMAGGIIRSLGAGSESMIQTGTYTFGRTVISVLMNIYAMKMAGVFMITTSTIFLKTCLFPRWMVFLSYTLALVLLLSVGTIQWIPLVFPLWVFLISLHILIENLRGQPSGSVNELPSSTFPRGRRPHAAEMSDVSEISRRRPAKAGRLARATNVLRMKD
jgi:hypothetical protein